MIIFTALHNISQNHVYPSLPTNSIFYFVNPSSPISVVQILLNVLFHRNIINYQKFIGECILSDANSVVAFFFCFIICVL